MSTHTKAIHCIGLTLTLLLCATSVVEAAPGPPTGGGDFGAFGTDIGSGDFNGDSGEFGGLIGIEDEPITGDGRTGSPDASVRPAPGYACTNQAVAGARAGDCIPLLAPLGQENIVEVDGGAGASGAISMFAEYFREALPLVRITAIGFSVLWILIGSFYIMISGSDGGKRTKGKEIIMWALIGFIVTEFAAFFLKTLNNVFFV